MANIMTKIAQIRAAILGIDVRDSIASGIESINTEVVSTTARQGAIETSQTALRTQFDDEVINMTLVDPSSVEIVAGRTSNVTAETFDTVGYRIDGVDTHFANTEVVVNGLLVDQDCSAIIQNTYNALVPGQRMIIPHGTWLCENLIFNTDDVTVICLGILKPLNTTSNVLMIGKGISGQESRRFKGLIKIDSGSDWFTYTGVALTLYNLNESEGTFEISGFQTGLKYIGDATGCCYNKFDVVKLYNCQKFVVTENINWGWCNENTLFGGRYSVQSGRPNYDDIVVFDIGTSDHWVADSFHVIHPSVEIADGQLCVLKGQGHKLESVRCENLSYPENFIDVTGAGYCEINFLYDTAAFHIASKTVNATRTSEGVFVFDNAAGNLTPFFTMGRDIALILSGGTFIDTKSITSSYQAGTGTTVIFTNDTAVQITGFKFYPYQSINSSNIIDFPHPYILSSGAGVSKLNGVVFVGGSYKPAASFTSNNNTAEIAILLSLLGVKKFSLDFGGNIITKGSIVTPKLALNGIDLITTGGGVPTSGTHVRGEIAFYQYPAEAGTAGSKYIILGWSCTASGTPGTWKEMRVLTGG